MKQLQVILSKRAKLEKITGNLDDLHQKNEISSEEYEKMKSSYMNTRNEIESRLSTLRDELKNKKQDAERRLNDNNETKRSLTLKHKVGEIDATKLQQESDKLDRQAEKYNRQISDYDRLIAVDSVNEVGGYIEVNLDSNDGSIMDKIKQMDTGAITDVLGSLKDKVQDMSDSGSGGGEFSKPGVIANALLVIGVFLPVISFPMGSISLKGVGSLASSYGAFVGGSVPFLFANAWWLIFLLGAAAIAANFVMNRQYAKLAMMVSGGFVILLTLYGFINLLGATSGGGRYGFGMGNVFNLIGFGVYVLIIAGIMSFVTGLRYKNA